MPNPDDDPRSAPYGLRDLIGLVVGFGLAGLILGSRPRARLDPAPGRVFIPGDPWTRRVARWLGWTSPLVAGIAVWLILRTVD